MTDMSVAEMVDWANANMERVAELEEQNKTARANAVELQDALADWQKKAKSAEAENKALTADFRASQNNIHTVMSSNEHLHAENKALREALEEISSQCRNCEMDEEDKERADYEQGYDMCILTARAALQPDTENTNPTFMKGL